MTSDSSGDELNQSDLSLLRHYEAFEREVAIQQQLGGNLQSQQPGRIHFIRDPVDVRTSAVLGVQERVFRLRPRQEGQFIPRQNLRHVVEHGLREAMRDLINAEDIQDRDRIFVQIQSNRLNHATVGYNLLADEWREGSPRTQQLLTSLAAKLNSNEDFRNDTFNLSFVHVRGGPRGSGRRGYMPKHISIKRLREFKRCVIRIPQDDSGLCAPRALVTAKGLLDAGRNVNLRAKWIRNDRNGTRRDKAALELLHEANLQAGHFELKDIEQFSKTPMLQGFLIVVIDAERSYAPYTFGQGTQHLALLYDSGHYDVVTSLPALFASDFFCFHCFRPYNLQGHHLCPVNKGNFCNSCRQANCQEHALAYQNKTTPKVLCHDCNRYFYGPQCLLNHKTMAFSNRVTTRQRKSVCESCRRCKECNVFCRSHQQVKHHKCGWMFCRNCKFMVNVEVHQCYIQPIKDPLTDLALEHDEELLDLETIAEETEATNSEKQPTLPPMLVFFDIECMQGTERHLPNLLVAICQDSGDNFHVFKGEQCVDDFIGFLERLSDNGNQPLTVLAHNFKGYDSYPIIDALNRRRLDFQQLRTGGKVINLQFGINISMIDSVSFFQMPLAKLPKTFGLTELKKGYFPHLFNTPENQTYKGPIPAMEYYMPEVMKPGDDLDAFVKWHHEQSSKQVEFDFQKELLDYCKSDVKVLQEACMKFKRDFQDKAHFCPFTKLTIASACNTYYRMHCLKANKLSVEPVTGWRLNINHSHVSMEWLLWCEFHLQKPIQHARNTGECRIPGTRYSVDGFVPLPAPAKGIIYEFHGCWCHGCPKCFPSRTQSHKRLLDRSFEDVFQATKRKEKILKDLGYELVIMWECDWKKLKQSNANVQQFVDGLHLKPPLNPRDAFFGGRTNAGWLYAKCEGTQKIHYHDFKSVYPWVNKYCYYPIGHPDIHYNPGHLNIGAFFGIAKVTILPPSNLLFPVLPVRYESKLIFPLCQKCMEDNLTLPMLQRVALCSHPPEQRQLTGTWCTPEIEQAIAQGYTLKHIHEVWDFPDKEQGLFKDYIDTWLKIKEEASGYPKWCKTPEDQQRYIDLFFEREGIRLDPANIKRNDGLRALAKLMLNSMWGKFGQQSNKKQVRLFTDPQALIRFMDTEHHNISYISVLNHDRVEIHYTLDEHEVPPQLTTNIFVAAFTTMWARLRLLSALTHLQHRALYWDTDSVIHKDEENDEPIYPPEGDFLGDFTNELDTGEHIVEFCSGGPKNYGYLTSDQKVECKVKGFSLNKEGSQQLNYYIMQRNTLDELERPLQESRKLPIQQTYKIKRDAKKYHLHTMAETKLYQLVYCKRVVDPVTKRTYPYGYIQLNTDEDQANVNLLNDLWMSDTSSSSCSEDMDEDLEAAKTLCDFSDESHAVQTLHDMSRDSISSTPSPPPTPGNFLQAEQDVSRDSTPSPPPTPGRFLHQRLTRSDLSNKHSFLDWPCHKP